MQQWSIRTTPDAIKKSGNELFLLMLNAPAAWNTLPRLLLQQMTNTDSFKRHLKTHLFCQAF